ncbi:hypothetical protein ABB37_09109 [Leptomonas pyrrhocoris]|uniref:Uncharacterized protein n=1 Tax=Leptomonas pyrrhocoris TaxID=157538 RepID=A0A0M9FRI9_LEPPY|nr:hypothetical protein ABB37_09109 [Leptomonas pyrrhocoris]XP_015652846.1 hypothetical protein ABB37_09109 [Leptomonas pyrrhocoris]XP_015652847.1 hypothetical protein ABB37_09109 [Leptomonas pyrrhocoris]KPA74406.1 hypothetical protein ABB37_09109 [Leptomonas pyrrhocoris]KPA74407.1 hypothetical protein ABB37_09109 [Leptomonas pyrrhocoris]KPA74408.1 hypothetical protein ABB37_09109 [Leptomonas pyrrhocoris]|eukprot:XP_015652845.1 hypothetical protein ABB37_09109 [Leptomonas pyrrhocoris]
MGRFHLWRRSIRSRNGTRAASSTARSSTVTTAVLATPTTTAPRHLPAAIPCYNYYELFPEDAGPLGHVVIHDSEDMRVWRLVATPISAADAVAKGGCLQYVDDSGEVDPQYYEFAQDAEEIYGSASYQRMLVPPLLPGSPVTSDYVAAMQFPTAKHVDVGTSYGALSDEALTEVQTCAV